MMTLSIHPTHGVPVGWKDDKQSQYVASVIEARVLDALVEDDQLDERALDKLPVDVVELLGSLEGEGARLYRAAVSKGGRGGGGGNGFRSLSDHDQGVLLSALKKAARAMELDDGDQKKLVDYAIKSITRRIVPGRTPMAASRDVSSANLSEAMVRRGEKVAAGKSFGNFSTFTVGDDEGTAFKAKTADGKIVPIIMRGERGKGGEAEVIIPGGKRKFLTIDAASKLKDIISRYDLAQVPELVTAVLYGRKLPESVSGAVDHELDEVSPPGFEGTVLAMKKHKGIKNPWALAWSMKGKGDESHYRVKRGKPVHKKEETMREASDCPCDGNEHDDCDCEPCARSRAKKARSEGFSGALSSAMSEAVRSGEWFVIIDKKTGKAVGDGTIFLGSRKADAALDKMGGERKTGYQVMDAMWHNPTREALKKMGMIGEGQESDAGYEPAYALPDNKSGETTVDANAAFAAVIDDVFRDNKTAKPETVEPLGVAKVKHPTRHTAEEVAGESKTESRAADHILSKIKSGEWATLSDLGRGYRGHFKELMGAANALMKSGKIRHKRDDREGDMYQLSESISAFPADERVRMAEAYDRMVAGDDLAETDREAAELYKRLVVGRSRASESADAAFEAALVTEGVGMLNESGHHFFDGKSYFVDTAFMNAMHNLMPGQEMKHMGFGEFEWVGPEGKVDFDRMRGKDFPGQSGRSHKLYDDKDGKLVKKLIAAMEKKGKSELVKESLDEGYVESYRVTVRGDKSKIAKVMSDAKIPFAFVKEAGGNTVGDVSREHVNKLRKLLADNPSLEGRFARNSSSESLDEAGDKSFSGWAINLKSGKKLPIHTVKARDESDAVEKARAVIKKSGGDPSSFKYEMVRVRQFDEAAKLKGKKLDAEINRLFKAHGQNIQFNIMDLGKIRKAGVAAAEAGEDIEAAVVAAIKQYRVA